MSPRTARTLYFCNPRPHRYYVRRLQMRRRGGANRFDMAAVSLWLARREVVALLHVGRN